MLYYRMKSSHKHYLFVNIYLKYRSITIVIMELLILKYYVLKYLSYLKSLKYIDILLFYYIPYTIF